MFLDRMRAEFRAHPKTISEADGRGLFGRSWGSATDAGVDVTEDSAMSITALFCALKIISETVAQLPLFVYRQDGRNKVKAREHPLFTLLHDSPNPEQTAYEFQEYSTGTAAGRGAAYAEIIFNGAGQPSALWPLPPGRTAPTRAENGELLYKFVSPRDNQVYRLPDWKVLKLNGFSTNGLTGVNIFDFFAETLGVALATREHGARYFGNGARVGGTIEYPGALTEEARARLKADFGRHYGGLNNAHRVAILEQGVKYTPETISNEASQFLQTQKYQVSEISRILRIPLHMLGDLDRATFSNIEHQGIEFITHTVLPWTIRFENRYRMQLLSQRERQAGYFVKYQVNALLRGDMAARSAFYTAGINAGWMTRNEARVLEDQDVIDGLDAPLVPLNMMAVGSAPPLPAPEGERSSCCPGHSAPERRADLSAELRAATKRRDIAKAFEPTLQRAAQDVINRERADLLKVTKNDLTPVQLRDWLRTFYEKHPEFVQRKMTAPIESLMRAVFVDLRNDFDGLQWDFDDFMAEYVESLAQRHSAGQFGQLDAILKDTPADDAVQAVLDRSEAWEQDNATKIARRETVKASNGLTLMAYTAAGVATYRWVTLGKNCPFCGSMDGRTIKVGGSFFGKGDGFEAEGGAGSLKFRHDIKHPPFHSGCDCQILPA